MVKPLPLPPDGVISKRRMAQIRRRHREKIHKMAQRQKDREAASEQKKLDKLEKTTNKPDTIEPQPEIKEENPNSPRRILRDIQMERLAKRKKPVPIENREFYPEKLKRKVVYRRIKLSPNQELVPLGWINKRKRSDPKKGSSGEEYELALKTETPNKNEPKPEKRKVRNIIREETVEEIIMRIEETDSLTDEDLMEILTCPSPVWWEEPMNPFYFDEEPINKKLQKTHRKRQNQASIKQNQTDNHIDKLEISLANRDEKFVAKRSSLETILSNMKEKDKNSQNNSRKLFQKRQWKNLDEANPAYGLKRNSKGRFLKKKIGSSPITISDVSDKEETPSKQSINHKTTPKTNDLDKPTTNEADITKTTENNIDLDNDKDNLEMDKTLESNTLPNNNSTNTPVVAKNDNINESSKKTIKTEINKELKENKEFEESPKALIWTSNSGERKVITFTQDSEMSSDGVEIVTDSVNLDIPQELPPLKWYPRTDTTENVETSDATSDEICDQQADENDEISENAISMEISNSQEPLLQGNIEGDGNINLNEDMDMESSKRDDENELPIDNNIESDSSERDNDTNYINDGHINNIESKNGIDTTDSDLTKTKAADERIETDEKSIETNKNPILGVLEKAMDYFRKKSKNVASEGIEKDKNSDEYVVVYKIDETYKNTSDELNDEELKDIGEFNEIFEGNVRGFI